MGFSLRKFILYLVRWQLSTPILWLMVRKLGTGLAATIIANLIGGVIFFWIDRFIFTSHAIEVWHFRERGKCKCGKEESLWRLVLAPGYDKRKAVPEFKCIDCSRLKTAELREKGYKIIGKGV